MTEIKYDLKTGHPSMDLVNRDLLKSIMSDLVERDVPMQYTTDSGDEWTREQLAAWLTTKQDTPITADEIQITGGAIPSTDHVARLSTKAGDIVLVENPTFYYIIHKLELNQVEVLGVPMQPDGVDLNKLEDLCKQYGSRVSMFYSIPSFHNPTGYTYTPEKRRALVELAKKYNFTICEDATYQHMYYDDNAKPPPLLREFDEGGEVVLSAGSFNKLITPALRIGWLWANEEKAQQLRRVKTGVTSAFMSQVVGEMIVRDELNKQVAHAQKLYGDKYRLMRDALIEFAPDWLQWVEPDGGFFVWVTLPEYLTATDVLTAANAAGVSFMSGQETFVRGEAPDRYMRICFGMRDDDIIVKGVEVLCDVLKKMPVTAN